MLLSSLHYELDQTKQHIHQSIGDRLAGYNCIIIAYCEESKKDTANLRHKELKNVTE